MNYDNRCPYCERVSSKIVSKISIKDRYDYEDEHFDDTEGLIYECEECGVFYIDHRYDIADVGDYVKDTYNHPSMERRDLITRLKLRIARYIYLNYQSSRFINKLISRTVNLLYARIMQPPLAEKYIESGGNVLDIGCAHGEWLEHYFFNGVNVYGCDPAPWVNRVIDKKKIHFSPKDFLDFELPEKKFDLIIMRYAFYRLQHQKEVFQKISRILKDDGELLIINFIMPKHCGPENVRRIVGQNYPEGLVFIKSLAQFGKMLTGFDLRISYAKYLSKQTLHSKKKKAVFKYIQKNKYLNIFFDVFRITYLSIEALFALTTDSYRISIKKALAK